ncbi:MAG: DUF3450 domain-containing protein [Oceanococcus sp.]
MLRFRSLCAAALAVTLASPAMADTLGSAMQQQKRMDTDAKSSQKRIDKLDDEAQGLLTEYRYVTRETTGLKRYNTQLERQINSQLTEMESIKVQLDQINDVSREVVPMMLRMVDTLDKFIGLDMPFLTKERGTRVQSLKEIMDRADVTTSEKYRRIVEAYQVEMEYARTIEAYQAELDFAGQTRTVDFLRVGRIALMYQTLDGEETGFFNTENKQWEELGSNYEVPVRNGLRIARKQAAPSILTIPVAAPKDL